MHLLVVGLLLGCGKSAPDAGPENDEERHKSPKRVEQFRCRKAGLDGAPWRECAPDISQCDKYGCFERDEAFCFPVVFVNLDNTEEQWTICAPSERECEEWNDDRKRVVNRSTGPCFKARPDEYVALKPQ